VQFHLDDNATGSRSDPIHPASLCRRLARAVPMVDFRPNPTACGGYSHRMMIVLDDRIAVVDSYYTRLLVTHCTTFEFFMKTPSLRGF